MGQQQLLLIVLGVIIVGIAVVVGINVFSSSATSSNRDLVVSQLTNIASSAQQYFRKPASLGGGGNDFNGFKIGLAKDIMNEIGNFTISTSSPGTDASAVSFDTSGGARPTISSSAATIYVIGSGTETGNDGTNPVKAYATVTKETITTTVSN